MASFLIRGALSLKMIVFSLFIGIKKTWNGSLSNDGTVLKSMF